jgi:hypothetical protein
LKYLIVIGFVNRLDLLQIAIQSIQPFWPYLTVIDNSESKDLRHSDWLKSIASIYEPPIPLNFCQMMNLIQKMGMQQGCDVVMFMHNDAEAPPGVPLQFLAKLNELQATGRKWGVALTNYDILVAFNMEAVKAVGLWDSNLPSYFTDADYYCRIWRSPYEEIETGLPVIHHNLGGSTYKSDPYRNKVNDCTFKLYEQFYIKKWGGTFRYEKYTTPFNR